MRPLHCRYPLRPFAFAFVFAARVKYVKEKGL